MPFIRHTSVKGLRLEPIIQEAQNRRLITK